MTLHLKQLGILARTALFAAILGLAACASTPDHGQTSIMIGPGAAPAAEAADAAIMETALASFQKTGFAGLAPHLPTMRAALDRAPAEYPLIRQMQNGDILVHANDADDGMMLSILASAIIPDPTKKTTVRQAPNVYPTLALLLGSEAVERQAYTEALTYLDRGLAIQPNYWVLMNERAAALVGLRRLPETLAMADAALASDDMALLMHRAPFLRRRGYVLVEMGKLEEAKAAYEESLKEEPDSAVAKQELEYIRGLQAGKPKTPTVQIAPGAKGQQN